MRRTRAILAMLLAATMAIHALVHRPSSEASPPTEHDETTVPPDDPPQHSFLEATEEEDEVVAVEDEVEHELIPVTIQL